MIYTSDTKKAMRLCFEKHKNQVDKENVPYVFHPFTVAFNMDDEDSTIVALLHDVIEDTDTTLEEIKEMGFSSEVIEALKLLTHDKSVDYFDYINLIKTNPLATKVKLADLEHNSDITRLNEITQKDLDRIEKYKKAKEILMK